MLSGIWEGSSARLTQFVGVPANQSHMTYIDIRTIASRLLSYFNVEGIVITNRTTVIVFSCSMVYQTKPSNPTSASSST